MGNACFVSRLKTPASSDQRFMATIEEFIVETSHSISAIIDFDTFELRWMNRVTHQFFPDAKQGTVCYQTFFGRTSPCVNCPLGDVRRKHVPADRSFILKNSGRWLKMKYQYARIDGNECCVCIGTDITALKSSLVMTQKVLDSLNDIAYIIDRETFDLRFANRALQDLLPEGQSGKKCYELLWDRNRPCDVCPMAGLKSNRGHSPELYNPKLRRLLSLDSVLLKTAQNENLAVFTGHDVTHRLEYESRLKKLAYSDSMLDIGNLAGFHRDIGQMMLRGESAHLCLASIRNFNNINMLFGREHGDAILKSFAKSLLRHIQNNRAYRVGGCKFAFVADSPETGHAVLNAVWQEVFTTLAPEERNVHIPMDCVFIGFPRFADTPETLLINAEYKLKTNTRSEYGKRMVFDDRDRIMMERRSVLTSVIRTAIDHETFRVFYQPIYSFTDRSYTKAEALLRLYDEQLGWITPDEFIPVAEEQGLIHDLGLYVLEHACRKLVERKRIGVPPVDIHINVSTIQFSRNDFFDTFMGIVDRHGIAPSEIVIEVTESVIIQSFDFIMPIMKRFIARGIRFSLDDFGTGYSSLNYIALLPISGIKLDKSFIDRSEKSDTYALLIRNVVEIARSLRLELIVEGVETREQLDALKDMGCLSMQGYYFCPPMPGTELDKFFMQKRFTTAIYDTPAIS